MANALLVSHVQYVQALEAAMKARDAVKGCTLQARDAVKGCTLQATIPDLEKHTLPNTYNGAYVNEQAD